ncbi:hypothetical protein [Sandarakinorhabdus sp.]|uniref:hypothetical protein n=1 Tax=Sandarakinorhabdus sp. TaxID=1916663 RepID=UPI003F70C501
MRRILGFMVALLGLLGAGLILWRAPPVTAPAVALAVPAADAAGVAATSAPPPAAPDAPDAPLDREARRLARYDKDADGQVSRAEFLVNRRKAFDKADRNRDGRLDFEEFAAATAKKFATADRNGDGRLSPQEFAATAVKRTPKPACVCPVPAEE